MSDILNVRRNILLLASGAIIVASALFILAIPAIIHFSPQAARQAQSNLYFFAPIVAVLLLGLVYSYLRPIHAFGRYVTGRQPPPPDLAQQARTHAFSAPFYLFFLSVSLVGLSAILANLYGLIARPGYAFALHFSYSVLIIATSAAIALIVSILLRRILQPVLIATADLAQDIGRRYEIRLRLAIVMLALNFIVFYFLAALSFNQVYQAAKESTAERFRQWGRDVAQAAPYLDDETLLALITGSEILRPYDANPALSDPAGRYLIPAPDSHQASPATRLSPDEPIEKDGRFTLTFPLARDDGTWHLSVTYSVAPERAAIVRNTLFIMLIFGAAMLGLTLVTIHYLADDITRDLKYVTARLLDIARRGHVGEKVRTLSLDEVGDLIAAFDRVREAMAQQQRQLNRRVKQMRQLHTASLALTSSVDFQQMLNRICQVAQDITASDTVSLFLYNPDDDSFVRASHRGYEVAPDSPLHIRPQGMTRTVLTTGQPILVPDIREHPLVNPEVAERGIRSVIVAPVISRTQGMGVLYVNSRRVNAYDEEDLQMVLALASQAGAAIENARLLDETMTSALALEQRARNLLMINRISTDLTSLLDPYEIFNATARHMVELMDVDHCGVAIFGENAAEGVVVAEYPAIGTVGKHLPRAGNPATEQVLRTKKPLAVADIHQEPLLGSVRETLAEFGIRAVLIAPLVARDQVIGTIGLDVLHKPYEFSHEEQELCRTIAAQAAIAASNARLLYDLQQQSRALARKSQELAEESAKLDAVLTNMADGLVVTDLTGRIMVSNPAFKTMAGLPLSWSLRGRLLDETFSLAALRQVIAEATANPDQVTVADLELPDGRVFKASASALHMQQAADPTLTGQVMGVVTLLRDITHEVEVDRMKTEFISAVSHELRTPLTSILGFANLIQREFQRRIAPLVADGTQAHRAAARIQENLTIIESESQRLTQLINDVLDIAKMESGRVEWHMADVHIADVVQGAVNTTAILAQERNLTLNVATHGPLPPVWGDQDRLVQVMTNLLSNAIKFTPAGEITVSSWAWRAGEPTPVPWPSPLAPADLQPPALIVSVTDTGIGIAPEDVPLVFERFRQAGDTLTEKPKGSGLGLSISKEIVEHHGGAIWVESEPGVGSAFYFTLPLVSEPVGAAAPPLAPVALTPQVMGEPSIAAPTRQPADARLILVVDDEPHIRQLLRQVLTDAGYRMIEAADGDTAMRQARLMHPDLIVLDVIMPGISGFGVIGTLRADPETAHIPIVILSVAEEATWALELGARACLTKPVDVPRLLSTVAHLVGPHEPMT